MGYVVGLDDGHGFLPKPTPGKRSPKLPNGLTSTSGGDVMYENEFNHETMMLTKKALERCGIGVVLTSPGREDTSLGARVRTANNAKVDIFVSAHANAHSYPYYGNANGIETFIFDRSAKNVKLGNAIQSNLIKDTGMTNRGLKTAQFYVISSTTMPAALVEYGFMDNAKDIAKLVSPIYRKIMAEATCKGICEYFGISYRASNVETVKPVEVKPVEEAPKVDYTKHWAHKNRENLKSKGIVINDDRYDDEALRGEVTVMCSRVLENKKIIDMIDYVQPEDPSELYWAETHALRLESIGVELNEDRRYSDKVTRAEAYAYIHKLFSAIDAKANLAKLDLTLRDKRDDGEHWATRIYERLNGEGLTIHQSEFDKNITRGEFLALLDRAITYLLDI